jgi:NAD+ kinase
MSMATTYALVAGGAPIGLLPAPGTDAEEQFDEVDGWCRGHDVDLLRLSVEDPSEKVDGLQLVIALGGDGTILRALRVAAPHGIPVLGVNFGHVGFLADVGRAELGQALAAIAAGHARVERRSALHAVVRNGPALDELAYNDVVLGRRAGHGAGRIVVTVDGTRLVDVVGDGVVVATGLGSTAYTVSAGGPAVSPLLDPMVLTPVAANTGPLRSLVISIEERLRLIARDDSAPMTVEIDGQTMEVLEPGGALDIGRAEEPALLVRTAPVTFYDDLRDRLLTR